MPVAWSKKGYDQGMWTETEFCSEQSLRRWHSRVMRLPAIGDESGEATTTAEADREKAQEAWPNLSWMSEGAFRKRFYKAEDRSTGKTNWN